jgi:hypothetical protein
MGTGLRKTGPVLKLYAIYVVRRQRNFRRFAYTWKNESSVFTGTKSDTGLLNWNAGIINMFATIRRGRIAHGSSRRRDAIKRWGECSNVKNAMKALHGTGTRSAMRSGGREGISK